MSKEARFNEIQKQFEKRFSDETGFIRCYTQDADYNYIDPEVQLAWKMYLKGHSDAYSYLKHI